MRAHMIKDGLIVNTIEVETLDFMPGLINAELGGAIGDLWDGEKFTSPIQPVVTQFELDQARYQKRAAVRDELIAFMAADNMSRVRSGAWTVPQLVSLMADPAVSSATSYMSTLSYELAAQAIGSAATPLLTPEIRAAWIAKLQAHFYLEG